LPRPSRRALVLGAALAVWAALDFGLHAAIATRREEVWRTLGPQFAIFAQLDPPSASGLAQPHVAPALQLARDVIAIDSTRVALVASLDTPAGRSALALDLAHRLAREGAAAEGGAPQLLVMADRTHAWSTLTHALALARDVGARRVEILLTRGAAPVQRATDPPEAAYALPRDFGAVVTELGARGAGALAFGPDEPFERVASELARRARAGERVRLALDGE
jgi:hypothetical protein